MKTARNFWVQSRPSWTLLMRLHFLKRERCGTGCPIGAEMLDLSKRVASAARAASF
jgi:hypothetical protein